MIEPIAKSLNVPLSHIYANTLVFDDTTPEGAYMDFDRSEYTSKDMGKAKAIDYIKQHCGYQCVVMVGDGATDLQAKPPVDAFIGFGGNVVRDTVREKACWYVRDFEELIHVIK